MTDNILLVETTALAHAACALQESGILLTDFCRHTSQRQSLSVLEEAELPEFKCSLLRIIYCNNISQVEIAGKAGDSFSWPRASNNVVR